MWSLNIFYKSLEIFFFNKVVTFYLLTVLVKLERFGFIKSKNFYLYFVVGKFVKIIIEIEFYFLIASGTNPSITSHTFKKCYVILFALKKKIHLKYLLYVLTIAILCTWSIKQIIHLENKEKLIIYIVLQSNKFTLYCKAIHLDCTAKYYIYIVLQSNIFTLYCKAIHLHCTAK